VFLRHLYLKNFRSCDDVRLQFDEALTILVGENNAGKTNVLEALRLITLPSDGRRLRYPEAEDVRRGSGDSFEIEVDFAGLSSGQRGLLLTALKGPEEDEAIFGLQYTKPRDDQRRGSYTRTVGPRQAPEAEAEARALIRHVHLPALRDAVRELASSSPARIEFLLRQTSTPEQRKALLIKAQTSLGSLANDEVIGSAEKQIRASFEALTMGVQPHDAHLRFADPTLLALARDLRFKLSLVGLEPTDLTEAGLGYANLLFLSTVLVELRAAKDADLTLFLVEEPEAHLHPQLQAVTLAYLREQASESAAATGATGSPAGRIQVIVSTHSPNLSAAVSARHLVVIRSTAPTTPEPPAEAAPPPRVTRGISVARLGIPDQSLAKIDRYLDVTRSALMFSRRVLLVEGLAEALLVPVFGQLLFAGNEQALARLRATTIVAIDGVDFEPYVSLLLTPCSIGSQRIADRLAIVTDEDLTPDGAPGGTQRREALNALAVERGAVDALAVSISPVTLEASLLGMPPIPAAQQLLKEVFLECHPRSGAQWQVQVEDIPPAQRPLSFVALLTSSRTRKGDFAQRLAARAVKASFPVPPQFASALRFLIEG
jgi:putative ATP-dependent endonuclease of the OLD family